MYKSSFPYNVAGIASITLPISAITLAAVTVVPTTSITAASAVAKGTNPSNCPAVALAPLQIETSIDSATLEATCAIK